MDRPHQAKLRHPRHTGPVADRQDLFARLHPTDQLGRARSRQARGQGHAGRFCRQVCATAGPRRARPGADARMSRSQSLNCCSRSWSRRSSCEAAAAPWCSGSAGVSGVAIMVLLATRNNRDDAGRIRSARPRAFRHVRKKLALGQQSAMTPPSAWHVQPVRGHGLPGRTRR
jgi:hypothetical protein